jgi:anti-sigma B factor antagonist
VSEDEYLISLCEVDGTGVVHASGLLDLNARAELVRMLAQASAGGRDVVVDLSGTMFIDSTGLKALLDTWRSQTAAGQGFVLRNPSARVRLTVGYAGLADVLPIEAEPGFGS